MIYFCADDYGLSKECNNRIEKCFEFGVLNKISVFPNGEIKDFESELSRYNVNLSLHINLVEGHPLSDLQDINLLVSESGYFKYSFIGLFLLSLSNKRKELQKQLYKEIKAQIDFWKVHIEKPISIDSHQHTHMIPLVFKTLMQVIEDENLNIDFIRIPAEPIKPYILTPSLYKSYSFKGLIKQWLLKFLGLFNKRAFKKSKIKSAYFMGVMFSGKMTKEKIKKLLPHYSKIAEKYGRDIEIALHPGYAKSDDHIMNGSRTGFEKFYFSEWRRKEYDTLINFRF